MSLHISNTLRAAVGAALPLPPFKTIKAEVSFTIDPAWTVANWTADSYVALGFSIGGTWHGPSISIWNDGRVDVNDISNEAATGAPTMDPSVPMVVRLEWDFTFRAYINGAEVSLTSRPDSEDYLSSGNDVADVQFEFMAYSPGGGNYSGKFEYVDIQATSNVTPDTSRHGLVKDMVRVATIQEHDIPGTPYVPAKPGYYTYDTQRQCDWVHQGAGHYVSVTDPQTNQTHLIWYPDAPSGSSGVGGVSATWVCKDVQVRVYHPPTPAIPATPGSSYTTTVYESGYNLGWNAGARSSAVFFQDVTLAFKVGVSDVGAIVGMNIDDGTPVEYNGNTITFGFYCSHGVARVIRNGVIDPLGGAFTYDFDTIFRIERQDDQIFFSKDGSTTYNIPSGAPTGPGWMEASLYSGNDFVSEPVIQYTLASPIPPQGSTLDGYFRPMVARLTHGEIAEIDGIFPNMKASFHAGQLTPTYALINGDISILSAFFAMLTGEVGQIDTAMHPMECLWADHAYGAIDGVMAPMDGWLLNSELEGQASFGSFGYGFSSMTAKQQVIAIFKSTGQLLSAFTATITEHAELLARGVLNGSFTFTSTQRAVLWGIATTVALAKVPEGDVETWVINLDGDIKGSTQYQNYDFNSYAFIDGRYYGASNDGLVLLEGDTDDGEPVRAVVSLGKVGGSIRQKKTFQECFLGVSAQGNLFVKVIAEGREYIYKTRDFDPEMQVQRATFGKGLRTNYVTLEIYNEEGADFELDTVQFTVADMTRKI